MVFEIRTTGEEKKSFGNLTYKEALETLINEEWYARKKGFDILESDGNKLIFKNEKNENIVIEIFQKES